ncbi:hypothetical protein EMEDMD4_50054 [Sinorhizobium medicae]|uniref:Uncharacterized protein n=1 Tax=Sinorhizobium medicae TaxID=110321 RepID=A0A508X1K5_9HYPH|nr:hypothetical protein EMEDMD4_50054 [Sinorhizobium medicae]
MRRSPLALAERCPAYGLLKRAACLLGRPVCSGGFYECLGYDARRPSKHSTPLEPTELFPLDRKGSNTVGKC